MAAEKRKRYWIGFDLGGTKMLAAVFNHKFQRLGGKRRKTKAQEGVKAGLTRVIASVHDALQNAGVSAAELAGIGVGCPGPLNLDEGIVLETPNLGWKNTPLKRVLEEAFDCPVFIANDVDAGVYGEYRFGAGKGARCVVGVFPGTGIGGGCVYEGGILRGRTGSCMEIGHLPVIVDGPLCGTGVRGSLEGVASRLAISAEAASAAYRGEAPHLLAAAGTDLAEIRSGVLASSIEAGDAVVERIVRHAARQIGRTMAGVVNLLAPDVVVLGGGLVEAMPTLFHQEVSRGIDDNTMPSFRGTYAVEISKLGDEATVTGAAAWAEQLVAG